MFEGLTVGCATAIGPFSIRPIGGPPTILRFQIPSGSGGLRFTEMPDPEVDVIVGENPGPHTFLLPAGWVIESLQQSRMVLEDVLFAPGSCEAVDVVCVEQGRWSGTGDGVATERAPMRVLVAASERLNPATSQDPVDQGQQRAWEAVRSYEARSGTRPTGSLPEIMAEDIEADKELRDRVARTTLIEVPDGCIGYTVEANRRVHMIEIVYDRFALQRMLRSTMRSLAFDGAEVTPSVSVCEAAPLSALSSAVTSRRRTAGSGWIVDVDCEPWHGTALYDQSGLLLHALLLDSSAYCLAT